MPLKHFAKCRICATPPGENATPLREEKNLFLSFLLPRARERSEPRRSLATALWTARFARALGRGHSRGEKGQPMKILKRGWRTLEFPRSLAMLVVAPSCDSTWRL